MDGRVVRTHSTTPEEKLAILILTVTARDYIRALRTEERANRLMNLEPFDAGIYFKAEDARWKARGTIKECEAFLRTNNLLPAMTDVDPEYIIQRLRGKASRKKFK